MFLISEQLRNTVSTIIRRGHHPQFCSDDILNTLGQLAQLPASTELEKVVAEAKGKEALAQAAAVKKKVPAVNQKTVKKAIKAANKAVNKKVK